MSEIENLRSHIDEIDRELVALFEKRMETVLKIAEYKKNNDLEIFNQAREVEVIEKNISRLKNKKFQESTTNFLNKVMEISKEVQKEYVNIDSCDEEACSTLESQNYGIRKYPLSLRVGYQGEPGSFSEEALTQYFGDKVSTYNVMDFQDIFEALKNHRIDYGVLPIENSSTGGISEVYDLLRKYGFYIVGERCIKVEHNLVGPKGTKLEDITEVYSHPQAFQQCSEFFKDYPDLRLIPFKNTAISAKYINEEKCKEKAAVCSGKAAELYDLDIIKGNINYNVINRTRFIIIGRDLEVNKDCNKVSIVTTTAHQPGALYEILGFFAENNLNMIKIESRPIIDRSWEYFFYIDISGNFHDETVRKSIEAIKENSSYFKLLGNYVGHRI